MFDLFYMGTNLLGLIYNVLYFKSETKYLCT